MKQYIIKNNIANPFERNRSIETSSRHVCYNQMNKTDQFQISSDLNLKIEATINLISET